MRIEKSLLYLAYCEWCEEVDRKPTEQNYFYADFSNAIPRLKSHADTKKTINGVRVRVYPGISLKPKPTIDDDIPVSKVKYSIRGEAGGAVFVIYSQVWMDGLTLEQRSCLGSVGGIDGFICHPSEVAAKVKVVEDMVYKS